MRKLPLPIAVALALVASLAIAATASARSAMPTMIQDDKVLVGRQGRFPPGFYSALAGFLERDQFSEHQVMQLAVGKNAN